MKKIILSLILAVVATAAANAQLVIAGVIDGPNSGGTPKAVVFYATGNVADLSQWGFGSANNGGGTDGEEFTFFSGSVSAGQYVVVTSSSADIGFFTSNFSGIGATASSGAASINGDDAIELFHNGSVVDVFGDINTDGTGEAWDYLDSFAYRNSVSGSGFVVGNYTYAGPNALDGLGGDSAALAAALAPVFSGAIPEPSTYAAILGGLALGVVYYRRRKAKKA